MRRRLSLPLPLHTLDCAKREQKEDDETSGFSKLLFTGASPVSTSG